MQWKNKRIGQLAIRWHVFFFFLQMYREVKYTRFSQISFTKRMIHSNLLAKHFFKKSLKISKYVYFLINNMTSKV